MLTVRTFLLIGGTLVPIEKCRGPVDDPLYVEGALELVGNDVVLISTDMVDLVDQLWAYLLSAVESLVVHKEFSGYFPDQPIRLQLSPNDKGQTRFVIECHKEISVDINTQELVRSLLDAASLFFTRMSDLAPKNKAAYRNSLAKIRSLANKCA